MTRSLSPTKVVAVRDEDALAVMPSQTTKIKAAVLAAFEPDAGPVPGELSHFLEHERLLERLALPAAYRPLWFNPETSVLACATGVGAPQATASVMALGLDHRFDLTSATILITGVAGADPSRAPLASVVLPEYVVDGDLTHEIDAREIPAEWADGFVPIGKSVPYEEPPAHRFNGDDGIVFQLDRAMLTRALAAAGAVELANTEAILRRRALFNGEQGAPVILRGDELASSTFWHGRLMSERAARWVAYQTRGHGHYAITAMEDAGMLSALRGLAAAGRIDWARIVIARGVSNYDRPRVGLTAAESLAETRVATDSAYRPALWNAWRVGSRLLQL